MTDKKEIGLSIRRLTNLLKRDIERSAFKLGLDLGNMHGIAIKFFADNKDGQIFQKDFENKFSIRPSTASRILKNMEQKGLIKRVSVESDARLKKLVLTEKALDIHNKIGKEIKNREERMRKGITDSELQTFFNVMDKISNNLEENDA